MPNYSVSTSAALVQALGLSKPGDTIALAPGTYSAITIKNMNLGGVTITSSDPGNAAILTGLTIANSSGITVSHVEMSTAKAAGMQPFRTSASSDIHFDAIEVHGTSGLGAATTIDAFGIMDSRNVSVTNSDFHDVWHALGISDNTGITVSGNQFHDIRTDGIRGGGNSDMVISDNMFTDFNPAAGDHADAIQLWTTRTTESAHNITISDNLVVRGSGAAIQGIFIRDQLGNLPYYDVTITGNMILGGNANGIALDHVIGGTISGNTVIGTEDHRSWIRVDGSQDVAVLDNVSTYFMVDGATRDGILAGNTLALAYDGDGAAQVHTWLDKHADFAGAWGDSADVMTVLGLSTAKAIAQIAATPSYVTVEGTAGADKLKVKAGFDTHVLGGAGNDTLTGGDTGRNQLIGGTGDDSYAIKSAGDTVIENAGGGYDTVSTTINYTLSANVEMLRLAVAGLTGTGNALDNRIVGTGGVDRMYGMNGDDLLQGLDGDDFLFGGSGDDDLRADGGNDRLDGGDGNDTMLGGDGNDILYGGAGNDIIEGGAGMDTMTGGPGTDTFRFRAGDVAGDVITDFMRNQDRIDLRGIDARIATAKDDAFAFIGTAGFHRVAGEMRYDVVNGDALVSFDVNGDGRADFQFTVQHVTVLQGSDFLL